MNWQEIYSRNESEKVDFFKTAGTLLGTNQPDGRHTRGESLSFEKCKVDQHIDKKKKA